MINQMSTVGSQRSDIKDNVEQTKKNGVQKPEHGIHNPDIKNDKDSFIKVAKEMESLFAYQLLKVMRETTDNLSDDKKENGYDTYMTMFDMEVSRLFADRGIGLQDAIINWLERSQGINDKNIDFNKKQD